MTRWPQWRCPRTLSAAHRCFMTVGFGFLFLEKEHLFIGNIILVHTVVRRVAVEAGSEQSWPRPQAPGNTALVTTADTRHLCPFSCSPTISFPLSCYVPVLLINRTAKPGKGAHTELIPALAKCPL